MIAVILKTNNMASIRGYLLGGRKIIKEVKR